jgi:hypothetical protein
MSETKTRNFNDFTEFSHLNLPEDTGLTVILANTEQDKYLAAMVAQMLSINPRGLTDLYPVLEGTEVIDEIRNRIQTEYIEHGFGKAGAIMIDETHSDKRLPEETSAQLALLAYEFNIKVVLMTSTLSTHLEQDANLIVRVVAGEDANHTLAIIKDRFGAIGTIDFTYEDPIPA